MIARVLLLAVASFILSWLMTLAMKHLSSRIGFVDAPGHRKIHANPKPLGGGVAIFWSFVLPFVGILFFAWYSGPSAYLRDAYVGGIRARTLLAAEILAALFVIHLLGLIDDRRALGPWIKLIVQLIVTTLLVVGTDLRVLTALGNIVSIVLTVLWITAITNAFNFLDNMDGLAAGVAAVCSIALLITTLSMPIPQWFVAAGLSLLVGSLLGFLCFNFNPASIFMGDSGSLVIGFLLGILTVRTTFLRPGENLAAGWYAVFAPLIVLAVPLYDLIVVSLIRLSRGKSPFVGDTNHFSHRLVGRGMSRKTAVLCLYLITAATSVAAILLPRVDSTFAAVLIFCQTVLILGVVALLEQHPLPG